MVWSNNFAKADDCSGVLANLFQRKMMRNYSQFPPINDKNEIGYHAFYFQIFTMVYITRVA